MNAIHKFRILGLALVLLTGLSTQQKAAAQPGVSISFQTFYQELSPYGRWVNNPQYGSVWTPYVDSGFQPYSTNGYWEMTEYGNTWVSDYDWGWAPFHYGRWSYDNYAGWFWIPGYEWGPAWVSWRSGGGYYGWAPMGPGVSINVSINIPSFWWVFVPQRYMCNPGWHNHWVPRNRITHVYNQTTIINNYYRNDNRVYVAGPRREEVAYVTRREVPVRQLDNSRRGRVIVASNSRNNDPGNSRESYNRGNNSDYRNDNRRVEAERTPDRNDNNDRGNRDGYSYDRSTAPANSNRPENRSSNRGGDYQPAEGPSVNRDYNRGRESSSPASGYRTERSERSSGNSDFGRNQQSAPTLRSAPAERSGPSSSNREGSHSGNPGGSRSGGSERSSRSHH